MPGRASVHCIALAFLVVLAAPAAAFAEKTLPAEATQAEDLALLHIGSDPFRRPTVAVLVNGQGPFSFIVDTGASRTSISRALADRLGLAPHARGAIDGVTGSAALDMVTVSSIEAGAMQLSDVEAPIVSDAMLGRSDGLLGMDAVKGLRVAFDFTQRRVQIGASGAPLPGEVGSTPVEARILDSGLAEVTAKFGEASVWAIVDTGSDASLGNTGLREAIAEERWARRHFVEIAGGADVFGASEHTVAGEFAVIRSFKLGDTMFVQAPVVIAQFPIFDAWDVEDEPVLLLGIDVLEAAEALVIDYGTGEVRIGGEPERFVFTLNADDSPDGDSNFCTTDQWTGNGC